MTYFIAPNQLFAALFDMPVGHVVIAKHWLFYRQQVFHAQKLRMHDLSIEAYAQELRERGFTVEVIGPEDCSNQALFASHFLSTFSFTPNAVGGGFLSPATIHKNPLSCT